MCFVFLLALHFSSIPLPIGFRYAAWQIDDKVVVWSSPRRLYRRSSDVGASSLVLGALDLLARGFRQSVDPEGSQRIREREGRRTSLNMPPLIRRLPGGPSSATFRAKVVTRGTRHPELLESRGARRARLQDALAFCIRAPWVRANRHAPVIGRPRRQRVYKKGSVVAAVAVLR